MYQKKNFGPPACVRGGERTTQNAHNGVFYALIPAQNMFYTCFWTKNGLGASISLYHAPIKKFGRKSMCPGGGRTTKNAQNGVFLALEPAQILFRGYFWAKNRLGMSIFKFHEQKKKFGSLTYCVRGGEFFQTSKIS